MEIILIVIAIGIWLIWYELRYGIESRKENSKMAHKLSRKWTEESQAKWKEFEEARKDDKTWTEYLKKQGTVSNKKVEKE